MYLLNNIFAKLPSGISPERAFDNVFNGIVILIVMAVIIGFFVLKLRFPLIVGFIIVGILAGPSILKWESSFSEIHLLSEFGMALLLFAVGLKLDVGHIKSIGTVVFIAGIAQVSASIGFGYLIALGLGLTGSAAIYTAISLGFCSTIIIVKMLSDKNESDSLHGRIGVGILILEDILVVLVMIIITSLSTKTGGNNIGTQVILIFGKGLGLLLIMSLLMKYVLPKLFSIFAKLPELMILAAITWALFFALVSDYLGFSKEVGAFLAGVALASTEYREIISSRLVTLRDFLLLFFFLNLGMNLDLSNIGSQAWMAFILALFVLIFKPIIVAVLMNILGYRPRTSFFVGILVSQTSEFSLMLVALGLKLKHIDAQTVSLVTMIAIITIGFSSYMIFYADKIYQFISPIMKKIGKTGGEREEDINAAHHGLDNIDIIFYGIGTYGSRIAKDLINRGYSVLAIDFDSQAVRKWNESGGNARIGDAEDQDFPAMLPIGACQWIISSLRDYDINASLIKSLGNFNYSGNIGIAAKNQADAELLKALGADFIFIPDKDAAFAAADAWVAADLKSKRLKMDNAIAALKGHYIVCGYDIMGRSIIKNFIEYNIPHVVIESDLQNINDLRSNNILHINGDAGDNSVLRQAGVENAAGLIAVNLKDDNNIFITLATKGLNPSIYIITRSIYEENELKLKRAGADRVLSPYISEGQHMAMTVIHPDALDALNLRINNTGIEIKSVDIRLAEGSTICNKTISESGLHEIPGIALIAIKHNNGMITTNPHADHRFACGDELIITGAASQIDDARKLAGA